jgi:hypothetical protein
MRYTQDVHREPNEAGPKAGWIDSMSLCASCILIANSMVLRLTPTCYGISNTNAINAARRPLQSHRQQLWLFMVILICRQSWNSQAELQGQVDDTNNENELFHDDVDNDSMDDNDRIRPATAATEHAVIYQNMEQV